MYVCKGIAADEKEADREFSAVTVVPLFFLLLLFSFPASDFTFFQLLCCWQQNGCKGT